MKIKPVDNVYLGTQLPKKQNLKQFVDSIDKNLNENDEGPISHNGRMVDKDNIDSGLRALSDWLKYNTESAWRNEHRLLSDHDYNYYQEVIQAARDYLQED